MTKRRRLEAKRREVRSTMAFLLCGMACSVLVAFAETVSTFTIEIPAEDPAPEVVQIEEIDYSGIPYIEKVKPPVKEQIRTIAAEECAAAQLGSRCVEDTLGIAWTESRFDCSQIGDGGNSHGCFQIYRVAHPEVTIAQARDIDFATRWTVRNLAGHKYAKNRDIAVRMHNGDPTIPKTKTYLEEVNKYVSAYERNQT